MSHLQNPDESFLITSKLVFYKAYLNLQSLPKMTNEKEIHKMIKIYMPLEKEQEIDNYNHEN